MKRVLDNYHSKYISTEEFNRWTAENLATSLKKANLPTKGDFDDFVEKTDFNDKLNNLNKKVTSNKTKHVEAQKKLTDLTNKVAQIS